MIKHYKYKLNDNEMLMIEINSRKNFGKISNELFPMV